MITRFGVVAVVPFWSQADNMNVDSNYVYMRKVLPVLESLTTDTIFLLFFPNPRHGAGNWKYVPDGLQTDRIRFIPWPYDTQMSTGVVAFDVARWKEIEDDYGPVIYWLHQVESGAIMVGGYQRSYGNYQRPALIAQHHYIIHKSLPYPVYSLFPRLWAQMGGSIASDVVVYNSAHCRRMANESFSDYLSPEKLAELDAKSLTLPFGLLSGDEPVAPKATKSSRPVILYNHRFEVYKNPDETFAVLDELRQAGHDFDVWITQVHGQKAVGRKKDRMISEIKYQPRREDYLQGIAVPAINTINSVHETFCIALLDSILLGHIVVAPNSVTFPELVPPGYPFLFNNTTEQFSMLSHILTTWPNEYNKWREPLANYARETFTLEKYVKAYLKILSDVEEKHRQVTHKPHTLKAVEGMFSQMVVGKPYPPRKLRNVMHRHNFMGAQSMPTRRIIRECLAMNDDIRVFWNNGIQLVKEK